MQKINELDWQLLRRIRPLALERFCQRVLGEVARITATPDQAWHERYLLVYTSIRDRDDEMARAFNDARRSNALEQLALMMSFDLLTEDEFSEFTDETRAIVSFLVGEDSA